MPVVNRGCKNQSTYCERLPYERLTVEAALTGRYATALAALALHPLVPSHTVAKAILDEYVQRHGALMPKLS